MDAYEPIPFKLGIMIDTIKLYSVINVVLQVCKTAKTRNYSVVKRQEVAKTSG